MKRVGVIGYGRRIENVLDNVMKAAAGDVSVAAYFDTSEKSVKRIAQKDPKIRRCAGVDELLAIGDLDWIFIGSFNAAHRDHAVAALKAGKHVFCEKPVATTRQHCIDLLEARNRHPDKHFVVGFVLRYSAFYRQMKQWIDEGRLGRLISMEFNETLGPQHGAAMHGNWRRKTQWGGPMIVEKCSHDMDIMHWLTGSRPARVASFGGLDFYTAANAGSNELYGVGKDGYKYYDKGLATGAAVGFEENISPFSDDKDTIDNQVAIMELESGPRVSFHFCMHSAQLERRFYMCGTKGTIRGNVLTGTLEYTPVGWERKTETVKPIDGDDHGGAEVPMARDIAACMLKDEPMPTTLEGGVQSCFTCFGIEEARQKLAVVEMKGYWQDLSKFGRG